MLNYKVVALLIIAVSANLRNLETVTADPTVVMATYVKGFWFAGNTANNTDNTTDTTNFTNATYSALDTADLSDSCAAYTGFVANFEWTNNASMQDDVKFCLNVRSQTAAAAQKVRVSTVLENSTGWTTLNTVLSPPMTIGQVMGANGSYVANWAPAPVDNATNYTVWCLSSAGVNGDGGLNQYFDTKTVNTTLSTQLTVLLDNANPSAATGGCAQTANATHQVSFCPVDQPCYTGDVNMYAPTATFSAAVAPKPASSTNWLLYGGIAAVALIVIVVIVVFVAKSAGGNAGDYEQRQDSE